MSDLKNEILNYRVFGNGYPVVFLHGFLESISMWNYLDIPDGIRRILIDLPGHGESVMRPDLMKSMKHMAMSVLQVIDELGIDNYAIVGHSMGGYVGLELAKMDERCEKLMLLNSNFWTDSPQKKIDRKRVAKIVETNQSLFLYEAIPNLFVHPEKFDEEVKKLIAEAQKMDSKAIANASIAMSLRDDNSDWVKENSSKIVIVQGADDAIVLKERMLLAVEDTNTQLTVLDGVGHMAHIEASNKVAELVADFVQ